MEEEVLADDPAQVLVRAELVEAAAALAQQLDLVLRDPLGGAARGEALEQRPQLVLLLEVLRVVDPHGRTTVRRRDDEVLGLEHEQRLANRRAADPELTRQLLLLQPPAGLEAALDDRVADQFGCGHAGVTDEGVVRRQHPRHAGNHTCMQSADQPAPRGGLAESAPGCDGDRPRSDARAEPARPPGGAASGAAVRGRRAATRAPAPASTAVTTQNTFQPARSASAPSGGVQIPETTKTTVAATAKERPASSTGARSPAIT